METFEIRNLTFAYPESKRPALSEINLNIHPGEFITLVGPSGCGKSTLLRQLKTVLAPHGVRTGEIFFEGTALDELDQRQQSARIGFVQQSPENQIVTDKVWHELAFGLESLGYDTPTIRGRVAEMASFFGIQNWFYKNVIELSGGQKQLLNLASIMTLQPSVLILDEPTSQLDPIAASDFLATVGKINRELGTTIIITEHRLEEVFPMSDRVIMMDHGSVIAEGTPREVGMQLKDRGHGMFMAMPTSMRIWAAVNAGAHEGGADESVPITVREGREWLKNYAGAHPMNALGPEKKYTYSGSEAELSSGPSEGVAAEAIGDAVISLKDVWFKYEKDAPDVVKGVTLDVKKGEFLAVLGGNGTGKTTTLSIIAGLRKAYRGDVKLGGFVGVLPQNPQTLFVKKTVREDLYEILRVCGKMGQEEKDQRVARIITLCQLEELLDRHPFDLSGGEMQRAALAKVLLLNPDILLLDEPTKGLDAEFKRTFAEIMKNLQAQGVTIFMVSHDVEFCAEYVDRCALFFDGNVVTEGTPRKFFSGNNFYTTSANRIARDLVPEAVTASDIISCCGGQLPPEIEIPEGLDMTLIEAAEEKKSMDKLPKWRRFAAGISFLVVIGAFVKSITVTDLSTLLNSSGITGITNEYLSIYGVLIVALGVLAFSVSRKSDLDDDIIQVERDSRKLSKRTLAATIIILLCIPLTIFIGIYYLEGRKYYFITMLMIIEMMIPFAMVFEGRKPKARELVVIAVLCAIGIAGRAAFFMLPNFKPVMAIVIISGVAFGGESGFLVGAMTMMLSNILFGQGPWTPWQMFVMGLIGWLAGVLYRKGFLRRNKESMCVFGAMAAVLIYGGIMNPASAIMWSSDLNWKIILTYYISGFPVDLVHAAATALFLWFGAEPMLEKLDRIKVKYGLVE